MNPPARRPGQTPDALLDVASAPCSLHDVERTYAGLDMPPADAQSLALWRRGERERLIAARLARTVEDRTSHAAAIASQLDHVIGQAVRAQPRAESIISLYWPFRGEPDLRRWMESQVEQGARIALPLVVAKDQPLSFREWRPGCTLARGVWNIPYPADGAVVIPDIVIAPLVGFDAAAYRLGYGGGFFDRTLAALPHRPLAIGVGHAGSEIATIHPQTWDIPMDVICTGDEMRWRSDALAP